MQNFTEDQINQQDFVDNEIYDLVKRLIPSKNEIEWDIEMIGDIRDTINIGLSKNIRSLMNWNFIPDDRTISLIPLLIYIKFDVD
jgi:hypothetical protein